MGLTLVTNWSAVISCVTNKSEHNQLSLCGLNWWTECTEVKSITLFLPYNYTTRGNGCTARKDEFGPLQRVTSFQFEWISTTLKSPFASSTGAAGQRRQEHYRQARVGAADHRAVSADLSTGVQLASCLEAGAVRMFCWSVDYSPNLRTLFSAYCVLFRAFEQ